MFSTRLVSFSIRKTKDLAMCTMVLRVPKLRVVGSIPIARSKFSSRLCFRASTSLFVRLPAHILAGGWQLSGYRPAPKLIKDGQFNG
jgi:hypothetical protein